MALLLKHQTVEQFVTRLRAAYRDADRERLVTIASFVLARIQAGDLTDAQCRAAWGLNVAGWNTLKARMNGFVNARAQIAGAVGE